MVSMHIEGPVLLLMGPIGSFFCRFARYLEDHGVPVFKVSFPLHEFGFDRYQRLPFDGEMSEFKAFLSEVIKEKKIRHMFMYGDFIDPHRLAIELAQELRPKQKVDAWVFELGYIRPNYVSLELERANARSNLNKSVDYYHALSPVDVIPQARRESGIRWRKLWKAPTFIQHAFTSYPIIQSEHKLQPKPDYLLAQISGFLRKHLYMITERRLRRELQSSTPFFLVPLQVASDSQITLGSSYNGMEPFIEEVIASFARHAPASNRLVIKHHPRDRGYIHYGRLIARVAEAHGVGRRVLYIHDCPLGPAIKRAMGVVTINSTVGLQALYHATPTKVMGRTFYDLPGLTCQKPLDAFWQKPTPSDRQLFRKFYMHLLSTTQINGNFDGWFPFRQVISIDPELEMAASGPKPSGREILLRIGLVFAAFSGYYVQLCLLACGYREKARRVLEWTARQALSAGGVKVLVDRRAEPIPRAQIHIANHGHAVDFLLVQGYFCQCGITTAHRHLWWLLPFFGASARNYGHTTLNHLSPASRLDGLRDLLSVLKTKGRIFLHPSGSLVTHITTRVSGSLHLLGKRSNAVIVPWFCTYRGFSRKEANLHYKPLAMILSRVFGPKATIICTEGSPIEPAAFRDPQSLSRHIQRLYRERRGSLLPID